MVEMPFLRHAIIENRSKPDWQERLRAAFRMEKEGPPLTVASIEAQVERSRVLVALLGLDEIKRRVLLGFYCTPDRLLVREAAAALSEHGHLFIETAASLSRILTSIAVTGHTFVATGNERFVAIEPGRIQPVIDGLCCPRSFRRITTVAKNLDLPPFHQLGLMLNF